MRIGVSGERMVVSVVLAPSVTVVGSATDQGIV
jgi:hypothetical protein